MNRSTAAVGLRASAIEVAYQKFKHDRHRGHIVRLRATYPKLEGWTDDEISKLYIDAVSCFQSKSGKFFENYIEENIAAAGIPFQAQVHLDRDGFIVAENGETIPDIVFGYPTIGTHISNYMVLSLKTTSRERSKLDTAWTHIHPPRRFYYGTIEADYPTPEKFKEGETRKLVCVTTRKKDTRLFKLGFDDLVEEIQTLLSAEDSPPASV
jgi:hypothetical protein